MENSTTAYLIPNISESANSMTISFTDSFYGDYPDPSVEDGSIRLIISYISILIYSVAFLLGTTGNGLVIWFTLFRMKKTVNIVWFLNLAIADFIFTFFLPLSIVYTALELHWPFGNFMCRLNSTIAFLNMYASVFLLTVISIDRCISVICPVWCQNHRTIKLGIIVVLVVWILAFIFSVPYFVIRDTSNENGYVTCFNNFKNKSLHMGTVALRFCVGFFIPFSVIVSCYTVIVLRIRRNHIATSTKPFKIIVAVIIAFFVCWFPFHVISFLELQAYDNKYLGAIVNPASTLTSSVAFTNSCINPILYVFIGRDFKEKFFVSFHSIFEKAFTEDQTDFKSKTKSTSDSQLV